jgi:hypothetical protein
VGRDTPHLGEFFGFFSKGLMTLGMWIYNDGFFWVVDGADFLRKGEIL